MDKKTHVVTFRATQATEGLLAKAWEGMTDKQPNISESAANRMIYMLGLESALKICRNSKSAQYDVAEEILSLVKDRHHHEVEIEKMLSEYEARTSK